MGTPDQSKYPLSQCAPVEQTLLEIAAILHRRRQKSQFFDVIVLTAKAEWSHSPKASEDFQRFIRCRSLTIFEKPRAR